MQIRNKQPLTVLALLLASLPLSLLAQPADHAGRAAGDALLAATPERVPFQLAAKSDDLPLSRDSLFGTDEPAAKPAAKPVVAPAAAPASEPPLSRDALFGTDTPAVAAPADELPLSRDALFGDGDDALPKGKAAQAVAQSASRPVRYRGFIQNVMAYTTPGPAHWSEAMTRADVSAQGDFGSGVKWHLGARVDFDAVYPMSDFYPQAVNDNQTLNAMLRENYIDIGAGDWDFRLGRQHIIWGEMVGLLFGDVVSAKDMRHFVLPEFDILRIPQWAARAEYFKGDFHAEAIWIPVASYDNIGKPGAQFYDYTLIPYGQATFRNEKIPTQNLENTNYGLRLSVLQNGWDVAAFAYSSMSVAPTFYRQIIAGAQPTVEYQARHERIDQYGTTFAKDLGSTVLKGEAVYTSGQKYQSTNLTTPDGLVAQNTLTWVLGLDFSQITDTRVNVQVFQSHFFDHSPDIIESANENGYSLLVNRKFGDRFEAQALWISSLNRNDWMLRPRVSWNFEKNWDLAVGVDIFNGPPLGFFGRYDDSDRVYSELRYSF
ncbi:MAG: hypothetical protein AW11_00636 [Candidatus Accumulibacter regalis]|jgi:hypothetical protein|uniref:Alginate export domain-containing protein n=2 Tax=Candidatus Accumulibacter TaxID=327159 RepID=A0A011P732_ACCRE|nr:DUF1302 family protein [Accumulibacter sp.]EXI90778.1 MAG: hypothetical protein AW11_00636 [Candidatus Accumulibacter regalis]HRE69050.1 hypothetical protein [Accumulibacter sp.]HRE86589.1 hypothetical protein [Accumulibacter sp.]